MGKRPGGLEKRCRSPTTGAMNDNLLKLQHKNTSHVSTTDVVDNGTFNSRRCFPIDKQQRHLLPFYCCPLKTTAMLNNSPLKIQQNTAAAKLSRLFCNDNDSKKPLDDDHGDDQSDQTADLLNNINYHCRATTSNFSFKKPLNDDHGDQSDQTADLLNNINYHCRATPSNFSFKKHKVSTSLSLYNHEASSSSSSSTSSFASKQRVTSTMKEEEDSTTNLSRFRRYSEEDIEEEKRLGVTTKLSLGFGNPWKIIKKLTVGDVGDLSRLMLHSDQVEKHILPHMEADYIRDGNEVRVRVWDSDTHSEHQLVFTQWRSSKSYVLKRNWIKDFVKRRNLKVGDEVGLYTSGRSNSMLMMFFTVLGRAPPPPS